MLDEVGKTLVDLSVLITSIATLAGVIINGVIQFRATRKVQNSTDIAASSSVTNTAKLDTLHEQIKNGNGNH